MTPLPDAENVAVRLPDQLFEYAQQAPQIEEWFNKVREECSWTHEEERRLARNKKTSLCSLSFLSGILPVIEYTFHSFLSLHKPLFLCCVLSFVLFCLLQFAIFHHVDAKLEPATLLSQLNTIIAEALQKKVDKKVQSRKEQEAKAALEQEQQQSRKIVPTVKVIASAPPPPPPRAVAAGSPSSASASSVAAPVVPPAGGSASAATAASSPPPPASSGPSTSSTSASDAKGAKGAPVLARAPSVSPSADEDAPPTAPTPTSIALPPMFTPAPPCAQIDSGLASILSARWVTRETSFEMSLRKAFRSIRHLRKQTLHHFSTMRKHFLIFVRRPAREFPFSLVSIADAAYFIFDIRFLCMLSGKARASGPIHAILQLV